MTTRALSLLATGLLLVGCGRPFDAPRIRQVPGGDAHRGQAALDVYGCGGCHSIPGVRRARGRTAPPLDHFADRAYVAGVIPNNPDALVQWIVDPVEVNPDTAMPALGVTEEDARDMAAYLYTLRRRWP